MSSQLTFCPSIVWCATETVCLYSYFKTSLFINPLLALHYLKSASSSNGFKSILSRCYCTKYSTLALSYIMKVDWDKLVLLIKCSCYQPLTLWIFFLLPLPFTWCPYPFLASPNSIDSSLHYDSTSLSNYTIWFSHKYWSLLDPTSSSCPCALKCMWDK